MARCGSRTGRIVRVVPAATDTTLRARVRGAHENRVDAQLVGGAVLFGIGEGLVGYCSGPALAALGFGNWQTLLFTAAMLVGIGGFQVLHRASIVRTAAPDHAEGIIRLCNRSRLPLGNQE